MKDALLQRRLNNFGELLAEAWQSKKMLSLKISAPRIEEMHAAARKAGAIGGKVTGGGGICFFVANLNASTDLPRY